MSRADKELERKLAEIGENLLRPPSDVNELVPLLDKSEALLSKVDQSPSESMSDALHPVMKALISKEILSHSDADVRLSVAACLSEITRITAPDAPYDDELMKEIFQLIVEAFENLNDVSSHSYSKRVKILETAAKVRSCVMMLDIECEGLILDMFRHFLGTIRDDHKENVFSAMEVILSLVLEESEDMSSELLSFLLKSLKNDNKDTLPVARRLAEKVVENCSLKLKSCLTNAVKSLGAPMSDYSAVVGSVCRGNPTTDEENELNASPKCLVDDSRISERTVSDELAQGSGKMESEVSYPEVVAGSVKSPNSVMSNGNLSPKNDDSITDKKKMVENPFGDAEDDLQISRKKKDQTRELAEGDEKFNVGGNGEGGVPLKKRGRKPRVDVSEDTPITVLVSKIKKQKEKASDHDKDTVSATKAASKTEVAPKAEECVQTKSGRKRGREEGAVTPLSELKYDDSLVGRKVKVWWPDDAKFYPGVIVAYYPNTKKHKVLYADGDKETLLLKNERFEFVGGVKSKEENSSTPESTSKTAEKKKRNGDLSASGNGGSSSLKPGRKSKEGAESQSLSKQAKKGSSESENSSKELKSQSFSKSDNKESSESDKVAEPVKSQSVSKSGKKGSSNSGKVPEEVKSHTSAKPIKKESSEPQSLSKSGKKENSGSVSKTGKKSSSTSEKLPAEVKSHNSAKSIKKESSESHNLSNSGKKSGSSSGKLPEENPDSMSRSGKKGASNSDKLPEEVKSHKLVKSGKKGISNSEKLPVEDDSQRLPKSGKKSSSDSEKLPEFESQSLSKSEKLSKQGNKGSSASVEGDDGPGKKRRKIAKD
ncbi:sister chromatid cohesion protein PDS5 homolog C-like [Wolffia australiana]